MVNFIKEQYPPGTRIRLNSMDDPYAPILPGTEGEVDFVDDEGQIFMKWDNGRTLPLVPGEDSFRAILRSHSLGLLSAGGARPRLVPRLSGRRGMLFCQPCAQPQGEIIQVTGIIIFILYRHCC